jgi:hypothetical protein
MLSHSVLQVIIALVLAHGGGVHAAQPSQSDATAILKKAIEAQGGKDNVALRERAYSRFRTRVGNSRGVIERWLELPQRERIVACYEHDGKKVVQTHVVNEMEAWQKINDKNSIAGGEREFKRMQESLYRSRVLLLLPVLSDKSVRISDHPVDQKSTMCVRVRSTGHADIDLFFDKMTGLLIKYSFTDVAETKERHVKVFLSDYKDFNGLKLPVRARYTIDGKEFSDDELIEYRAVEKFPLGTFLRP